MSPSHQVKVGLLGGSGRMGTVVRQLIGGEYSKSCVLAGAPARGEPLKALDGCDVVIDFSLPASTLEFARISAGWKSPPALVVGATGFKLEEKRVLEQLAAETPVLFAPNLSVGVAAVMEVLRHASPIFDKLGYQPVIVETHHRHKKDAPSGTAMAMQRAVAPAGPGNIPTHSVRAGEVVGDHSVTFYGAADRVEIRHEAQDRSVFARGAIEAAIWLAGKRASGEKPGKILGMDAFFREKVMSA